MSAMESMRQNEASTDNILVLVSKLATGACIVQVDLRKYESCSFDSKGPVDSVGTKVSSAL